MHTTRRTGAAVALAAALLAVSACGETDRSAAPAPTPSGPVPSGAPSATPPVSSSPSGKPGSKMLGGPLTPPPVEDLTPTAGAKLKGTVLTVRGRVRAGTEGGCLVLESSQGTYTLMGTPQSSHALTPGSSVVVTGRLDEGGMSFCQEGRLLQVVSVRSP
jgi:hypothetical protein